MMLVRGVVLWRPISARDRGVLHKTKRLLFAFRRHGIVEKLHAFGCFGASVLFRCSGGGAVRSVVRSGIEHEKDGATT